MRQVSIGIPYPTEKKERSRWSRQYGLNAYYSGKHWSQRAQDADFWHWMVVAAVKQQIDDRTVFDKPVVISMYFNDNLDISNHAAMFKMIEDALKGLLIADDNRKCVVGSEMYFHDKSYIKITIREAEQND